jgi:hypothetical protein
MRYETRLDHYRRQNKSMKVTARQNRRARHKRNHQCAPFVRTDR